MYAVVNEVVPSQTHKNMMSEGFYDSETSRLAPISEFGTYVSKLHANGDKEFIKKFEVKEAT